ncbi:cytochrome c-type biogenesis protein CcmH [Novosphingobium bradum]|uniref:Cytochrome c-type biogenesis protein n=1 Tax=Novosphingobium bradum TaxID=1737444 RepID=A0ABV7INV5_9SPHN
MRSIMLAVLLAAAPAAAQQGAAPDYAEVSLSDPAREAQALALMDAIRCVVCQGQPISGSNADLAGDMRRMIRERIAAGESPDQVRAWLVGKYGDWVSFRPEVRGQTAPLWLVPLLALAGGGWLVSRRLRTGRRGSRKQETG